MGWAFVEKTAITYAGSKLLGDGGAGKANKAAANATELQTQIEGDKWDRYKQIYEPLEREIVEDAQSFDSPEKYKEAAADASAVVSTQFGRARQRLQRAPGADPSTAGYQAQVAGLELAQAANDSVAQNTARQTVEDTGYARKHAALSLGKGLDSSAAAGLGSAARTNAGIAQMGMEQGRKDAENFGVLAEDLVTAGSDWLKNRKAGNTGTI